MFMKRIVVLLQQNEGEALVVLAERERRDLCDQAAWLIHTELVRRGFLTSDLRIVTGVRDPDDPERILVACSACGAVHMHGERPDERGRDLIRDAHCDEGSYRIRVDGQSPPGDDQE